MKLTSVNLKKKPLVLMMSLSLGVFLTFSNAAQAAEYTGDESKFKLERLENKAITNGNDLCDDQYCDEFADNVLGFGSGQGGDLSNNTVTINFESGQAPEVVYGAMDSSNKDLTLSGNTVNLTKGSVAVENPNERYSTAVYGALGYGQDNASVTANNNTVNLSKDFGEVPYIMGVHAVAMGNGNITANNNVVNVNGYEANYSLELAATEAITLGNGNITANNNVINISDSTFNDGLEVRVADSLSFGTGTITANNNQLMLNNSTIKDKIEISAVDTIDDEGNDIDLNNSSKNNSFTNNSIAINGSTINGDQAFIATVQTDLSGTISNNSLTINNSTIENARLLAVLADGESGTVSNNTLTINNSTISNSPDNIISAVQKNGYNSMTFSNNKVAIGENVTLDDHVILAGVYVDGENSGKMTFKNNSVSIDSRSNLSNVDVYGVYEAAQTPATYAMTQAYAANTSTKDYNSTLEIHSYDETAKLNSANNFNTYSFFIEGDKVISDALLTTNEAVNLVNNDKTVDIGVQINGKASLEKGDDFTLFNDVNAEGSDYASAEGKTIIVKKGVGGYYEAVLKFNEDGTLQTDIISDLKQSSSSKALVEPQSAMMAFLNQGADLIAAQNIAQSENGWQGFGAISGGTSRYNTGSHIRINGSSFVLGTAMQKDQLAVGAFLEMGFANYHSHNNETSGEIYGDGKTNYKGVGLLARYDLDNAIYIDGNLRVGRAKVDYETGDLQVDGINASYDTSATYFGASVGAGKVFALNELSNIDLSARYSYSHLPGKSVTTSVDNYDFNNTNSHRAQLDAVYSIAVNEWLAPYVGLGYQYEFSGNSSATISGIESEKTRLQGNTGSLVLGLKGNSFSDNLSYDVGVKGYTGKREGIIGSIGINYQF